jgi:cysteine desulfuration protein SufE
MQTMVQNQSDIPPRLLEIIEDFQFSEGREKLELLIQYSERFPEIPERIIHNPDQMESVPECMTPVHMHAETNNHQMTFYFDVPKESPTVRGFAAVMAEGLNGATPEQILNIPNDFYSQMGLDQVLTHQRLNGMNAILAHMKRFAFEALSH